MIKEITRNTHHISDQSKRDCNKLEADHSDQVLALVVDDTTRLFAGPERNEGWSRLQIGLGSNVVGGYSLRILMYYRPTAELFKVTPRLVQSYFKATSKAKSCFLESIKLKIRGFCSWLNRFRSAR